MRSITYTTSLVSFIVEDARNVSARSLSLLRAIEDTVAGNEVLSNTFSSIAKNSGDVAESLCDRDLASRKKLDDDSGSVQIAFDEALDTIGELCRFLERKRSAAINDLQLRPDDGVVESFDKAIASVKEAFSHMHDLKWAVMENDADIAAGSSPVPVSDIEDFLSSLGR
ncbi:hypothetical protein [Bordetella genomosp. 12]|uniref:Uncharacterized protein n=1 Tax=Bordetella genomosp. 12 TaxID=463035 RepID=A0A261VLY9_9BORD|nr:hypothetical protein [Bordetella genomosp. 12]OZI74600.1 hypothetical protein CAL22_09080 [Bordetella genomosp. 12]